MPKAWIHRRQASRVFDRRWPMQPAGPKARRAGPTGARRKQTATASELPIYLDYNATSPLDRRVFEVMTPFFLEDVGNAGSRTHVFGQRARDATERARKQVADLLHVKPEEIVFT